MREYAGIDINYRNRIKDRRRYQNRFQGRYLQRQDEGGCGSSEGKENRESEAGGRTQEVGNYADTTVDIG